MNLNCINCGCSWGIKEDEAKHTDVTSMKCDGCGGYDLEVA